MREKVNDNFYVYLSDKGRFMEVLGQKAKLPQGFEDYDLFFHKSTDMRNDNIALSCGESGAKLREGIGECLDALVDGFVRIINKKGRPYYEDLRDKAIAKYGLSPRYRELLDDSIHPTSDIERGRVRGAGGYGEDKGVDQGVDKTHEGGEGMI